MRQLFDLLMKKNEVVIDTLPKAQLMNKLLLAKITILTFILAAALKYLAGWNNWMLTAGLLFVICWVVRGYRRDVQLQRQAFPARR
jgi:hypothetical protein